MANPTGSTYLQANTGYTWADGDVYEIVQTDQQEGAATGASFSGIGVDNQPHQILLNKIQYTHAKQLVDEINIAALQAFEALFTSSIGYSGWLKVGLQDVTRGQIDGILQWGQVQFPAPGSVASSPTSSPFTPPSQGSLRYGGIAIGGPYNFPITFPNACFMFVPITITPNGTPGNSLPPGWSSTTNVQPNDMAGFSVVKIPSGYPPTTSQFWVVDETINMISEYIVPAWGFNWVALGY
jgi:hypothetical protein